MLSQQNRNGGFTLIEALLALLVVSVAVSGAASIVTSAYQHIAVTEQIQRAHYLGAGHLDSLTTRSLDAGVTSGVYTYDAQSETTLRWNLVLTEITQNDMPAEIAELTDRTRAFRADLSITLPYDQRQIRLHSVILSKVAVNSVVENPTDATRVVW